MDSSVVNEEINRRKEDAYQMGMLTAKVDHLNRALSNHMIREEEITKAFREEIRKLNAKVYVLMAGILLSAPSGVSELFALIPWI